MANLFRRLVHLVRHRQFESDLSEELESHRAMKQEQLERSGIPATEASYASRRALGNVTRAREDARSVWVWPWLRDAKQDASYALRMLRRQPSFTAAVILVTSLGIGATTSVFGLLDALVLKTLPVRNPERLVYFQSPAFSYPIYAQVRERASHIFDGFFAWNLEDAHVDWNGELEPAAVLTVTGDFYSTLGVHAVLGRTFGPNDDRPGGGENGPVAVISHAAWQRRFGGDSSVLGKTVRIDKRPYTIVGVTPKEFFGVTPGLAPEIAIPLMTLEQPERFATPTSSIHLMARLRDGLSLDRANALLQGIWPAALEATVNPGAPTDRRALYLSRRTALLSAEAGYSRVRNQFADPLWLLLGLVGLLFTVACASTANLLLARGVARQRETAVRLAIGASRTRLVRQFLTESLVWTALAGAASVLFASSAGGALVAMLRTREDPIVLDLTPNWRVMLFALGLTLLTVVICSLLPAFRTTRIASGSTLRQGGSAGNSLLRRWSLGKVLVAAQVALTMVLLVGAALFVRSLERVLSQDAGFERHNLFIVSADAQAAGYEKERIDTLNQAIRDRLAAIPGVRSVSASMYPPISDQDGAWTQSIAVDGTALEPERSRYVYFNPITPHYFNTLGIRLIDGRDFAATDTATSPKVVIVNEALARRFFPNQNPIGRRVSIGRDKRRQDLEIVGLVTDAKYQRLQEDRRQIAYLVLEQHARSQNVAIEVRPAVSGAGLAEAIRREVRAVDPRVPLRIETVADRVSASLVKERVLALLASGLGLAALVLACAGVYGLLAYAVSREAKTIGIRLALGANRSAVLWMVLRDCLMVVTLGVVVGGAIAMSLGRYAAALLHQIAPTDAISLVAAAALMLAVAVCAGILPGRRAARIDPVAALKCE